MTKILFICHGNICRSPMCEMIMKHKVRELGVSDEFIIDSAAVTTEEIGNPVYPSARRCLASHGVECEDHRARKITKDDYEYYDMILLADRSNLRIIQRVLDGDPDGKISLLLDHTSRGGDIADPWYTGNFEDTWLDANEGCDAILAELGY